MVDDHPLVARGIAEYLVTHCRFAHAHIFCTGAQCLRWLADRPLPDLAVIDFWLPEGTALVLLQALARERPDLRLLAVSGDATDDVQRKARAAGAHGFLSKDQAPEVFGAAVAALRGGATWFGPLNTLERQAQSPRELPVPPQELGLTQRQGQVLSLMLRGLPNKRIARELHLSEPTVKEHITHILARLGVSTRMEAMSALRGKRIEL